MSVVIVLAWVFLLSAAVHATLAAIVWRTRVDRSDAVLALLLIVNTAVMVLGWWVLK